MHRVAQPLIVSCSSTGLHGQLSTHSAVHVRTAAFLKGWPSSQAGEGLDNISCLAALYVWEHLHAAGSSLSNPTLLLTISDTTLSCMTWREGESVKCFRFQEPMRATMLGAHGHVSARLLSVLGCCLVRSAR